MVLSNHTIPGTWCSSTSALTCCYWRIDSACKALADERRICFFTVLDVCTQEALAIEVDMSLPGSRVVQVLARVARKRGTPQQLVLDNGPELAVKTLDQWSYLRGVGLRFIAPGKPVQKASSGACRTSDSISTGFSNWTTTGGPWKPGAVTKMRSALIVDWGTERPPKSAKAWMPIAWSKPS